MTSVTGEFRALTKDGVFLGGGSFAASEKKSIAPNIFGTSNAGSFNFGSCTGALYAGGNASRQDTGGSDYWRTGGVSIDASRISPVYNNKTSDQLWPDHIIVETWMKFK